MSLMDRISKDEKTMMINYINDYACAYEADDEPCCVNMMNEERLPTVMRHWVNGKSTGELDKLFGDSLIHTSHIKYEKDEQELDRDLSRLFFNDAETSDVYSVIRDFTRQYLDFTLYQEGKEFWETDYETDGVYRFYTSVDGTDCWIKNKYVGPNFTYDRLDEFKEWSHERYNERKSWSRDEDFSRLIPEGSKDIKISNGMKMIKAVRKIAELCGMKDLFESFRIRHSMILNDKTLEGDLCLSIHPLDYMTMSDNDNDWSSCMSWHHTGCYRGGTVEMMNSPMVVVGYLKSDDNYCPTYSNGEHWNNKMWRCLFIVNRDFICSVKSYPYQNVYLLKECVAKIAELANRNWGTMFDMDTHKIFTDSSRVDTIDGLSMHFSTNVMYNDFGCGQSCVYLQNTQPTSWQRNVQENANITFYRSYDEEHRITSLDCNYSGYLTCMICGEAISEDCYNDEGHEFRVVCEDCYNSICSDRNDGAYCDECGDWVDEDEVIIIDDQYYCPYCFENNYQKNIFADHSWNEKNSSTYVSQNRSDWDLTIGVICENMFSKESSPAKWNEITNNFYHNLINRTRYTYVTDFDDYHCAFFGVNEGDVDWESRVDSKGSHYSYPIVSEFTFKDPSRFIYDKDHEIIYVEMSNLNWSCFDTILDLCNYNNDRAYYDLSQWLTKHNDTLWVSSCKQPEVDPDADENICVQDEYINYVNALETACSKIDTSIPLSDIYSNIHKLYDETKSRNWDIIFQKLVEEQIFTSQLISAT